MVLVRTSNTQGCLAHTTLISSGTFGFFGTISIPTVPTPRGEPPTGPRATGLDRCPLQFPTRTSCAVVCALVLAMRSLEVRRAVSASLTFRGVPAPDRGYHCVELGCKLLCYTQNEITKLHLVLFIRV